MPKPSPALVAMNEKRAGRVADALHKSRDYNAPASEDTNLQDFLADAMHYCDTHGHDFDALVESARAHYRAEAIEPDDLAEDFARIEARKP